MVHADTLFHLVPDGPESEEVLRHPDNQRFVSRPNPDEQHGLEIGFHVSKTPGRVMARLGRGHAADLVLRGENVSSVHVAIEVHPETHAVLLSVRSKNLASVTVATGRKGRRVAGEAIDGDCVLVYGQVYTIFISNYTFRVFWRPGTHDNLKSFAQRGYVKALEQERLLGSRDRGTKDNSIQHTWHHTRIHTVRRPLFREAPKARRKALGEGAFGKVYGAVDEESGEYFAVKVIKLANLPEHERESARSTVHSEVKKLEHLKHEHIIELLGTGNWDSDFPEIHMPMRTGSLRTMKEAMNPSQIEHVSQQVMQQMLSALDYMDTEGVCHRDIKPENILYFDKYGDHSYTFQLADFGLARNVQSAVDASGTLPYMAPEMTIFPAPQTPKVDVWSLFATIIDLLPQCNFPPPKTSRILYPDILSLVQGAIPKVRNLANMAEVNPNKRASAAQMLVALYDGQGLTTPLKKVPPLGAPTPYTGAPGPSTASGLAGPSTFRSGAMSGVSMEVRPKGKEKEIPLIKYPRPKRNRRARAGPGGGIAKPARAPDAGNGRAGKGPIMKPSRKPPAPAKKGGPSRHVAAGVEDVEMMDAFEPRRSTRGR